MSAVIDFRMVAKQLAEDNAESNVFFLIDQGGMPGLYRQLRQTSTCWASLFSGSKEESALEVAPLLILAGANGRVVLSRAIFSWIGERGTYTSTVMMLVSPTGLEPLQGQLSARLDVLLSEGMEAMLRFFDPRVFESLVAVMTEQQAEDFLGIASAWCYVDRTGRMLHAAARFKQKILNPASLSLSQEQESILLENSEVDEILNSLRSSAPDILSKIPSESHYSRTLEKIFEARQQNLNSAKQIALYVLVKLFSEHVGIRGEVSQEVIGRIRVNDVDELKIVLSDLFSRFQGG